MLDAWSVMEIGSRLIVQAQAALSQPTDILYSSMRRVLFRQLFWRTDRVIEVRACARLGSTGP